MIRSILVLALWCLCLSGFCQETKKVTDRNSSDPFEEVYHVLKADKKIKHGAYEKRLNGKPIVKGQFDNNNKTGTWEYYGIGGELMQSYNFTTKQLIFDQSLENPDFDTTKYARPALYPGGYASIFREVGPSIRYPSEAIRQGNQGTVYLQAEITEDGKMVNEKVVEGIGWGCDEEALRVFKLAQEDWIPALDHNGNPVRSEVTFPFNFKLR